MSHTGDLEAEPGDSVCDKGGLRGDVLMGDKGGVSGRWLGCSFGGGICLLADFSLDRRHPLHLEDATLQDILTQVDSGLALQQVPGEPYFSLDRAA